MPVVALCSAKGGGVTTSALALTLASTKPTLLAECDPAGGTLRATFFRTQLDSRTGLHRLATADREGVDQLAGAFLNHLVPLVDRPAQARIGAREVLAGLLDPMQASSLAGTWTELAEMLQVMSARGYDVFVDCGRLAFEAGRLHPTLTPAPLLYAADVVLLTSRTEAAPLALTRHLIEPLRREMAAAGKEPASVQALLITSGHDLRTALQILQEPLHAEELPWDVDTALHLDGVGKPPKHLSKTRLLRAARSAADQLRIQASDLQRRRDFPPQPAGQVANALDRLAQQRLYPNQHGQPTSPAMTQQEVRRG